MSMTVVLALTWLEFNYFQPHVTEITLGYTYGDSLDRTNCSLDIP